MSHHDHSHPRRHKLVTALIETFGFSPMVASIIALGIAALLGAAVLWIILSAPPRTLTISSGPPGSSFERYALRYKEKLAVHGVTLNIVPSGGSIDNLQRLQDPASHVDIALVQGGLVGDKPPPDLVSLGSVAYQPIFVFVHESAHIGRLSDLAGKRIGIGSVGSGVHILAGKLLEANRVDGAPAFVFVEKATEDAAKEFQAGTLDAVFLMGDSAPTSALQALLRAPGVQLLSFTQADAYARRMSFLNKIVLPAGSFGFGLNLPPRDVTLLGPTVEIVAREDLNSAVSDLLLSVLQESHGKSSLFSKPGEFPSPLEHEFPISRDALRFYKAGKHFTYELIKSFWLASLVNRLAVAIVPMLLIMIPAMRFLPVAYRWSVQIRIYRCYRPLLRLERDANSPQVPTHNEDLLRRLDAIEHEVNMLRVPASFAGQYYELRNHVAYVRNRLKLAASPAASK